MLETNRLILKPLTYAQLLKYIRCDHSLEEELQINPTERSISPELHEALEQNILPNVANSGNNYIYHTLWTAIDKDLQQMVADLCIVGEPNEAGEIEIGYGTYDEFQGKGYMTEMVAGIIEWTKTQDKVKSITANTENTNTPSFRVLQKNGFAQIGESESLLHWKLEIKK